MKTSTTLVIMTITMLLLALPAAASDYTLGVFGNANGDETINMQDVTYTELIILEYKDETQLADAKHDGEIDILDVTQIELTILGREKEITLIDDAERIVTVEKPVERIIPLHPEITEAIISLGAIDKIIAVADMTGSVTPPHPVIKELPRIGFLDEVDYEKIFELEPDIVIQNYWHHPGDIEATLEPEITVIRLDLFAQPTYTEGVKKLGYILGKNDDADEFIDWYQSYMDTISERVEGLSEDDKPRVFNYCGGEYGYGEGPPYGTYGKDSDAGRAFFEMTGSINIASDLPGDWIAVDAEWVLDQNPSVILRQVFDITKFGCEIDDPSEAEAFREDVMTRPGIEDTDAVENEKVYLIQGDLLATEWFVGVPYVAKWFHPELFDDLDPQAFHQEYLNRFQGIDYNVYEHGVFLYPQLE